MRGPVFNRPYAGPKEPLSQGDSLPGTPPLTGRYPLAPGGQLPPALPAVRPEFPVSPRQAARWLFDTFEPAWGLVRGIAIWDGMPLQFFEPRIATQSFYGSWNPMLLYGSPSIARGRPRPNIALLEERGRR